MTEVTLNPGDFYFTGFRVGQDRTVVRTLLGSCVAITLWHARLGLGGMCHYVMPTRGPTDISPHLDGHYARSVANAGRTGSAGVTHAGPGRSPGRGRATSGGGRSSGNGQVAVMSRPFVEADDSNEFDESTFERF